MAKAQAPAASSLKAESPATEKEPYYVNLQGFSADAYHVKAQGFEAFKAEHKGKVRFDLKEAYNLILADLAAYEKAQKEKK